MKDYLRKLLERLKQVINKPKQTESSLLFAASRA